MAGAGVIVRQPGEGDAQWFYGGGLQRWMATTEDTGGAFYVFEDHMVAGKVTPLHIHPDADELLYVLEGEIVVSGEDGAEHRIGAGGLAIARRGTRHAFMTTVETRILTMQVPGGGEAFFRHASEPATDQGVDGPVDFGRVQQAAEQTGSVVIVGPPPFAAPVA